MHVFQAKHIGTHDLEVIDAIGVGSCKRKVGLLGAGNDREGGIKGTTDHTEFLLGKQAIRRGNPIEGRCTIGSQERQFPVTGLVTGLKGGGIEGPSSHGIKQGTIAVQYLVETNGGIKTGFAVVGENTSELIA